jgi:hypothetical protein
VFVPAGDYFVGALGNSASITVRGPQYSPSCFDLGMTVGGGANISLYRAFTFGAFPTGDQSGETWTGNTTAHSYWLD